MTSNHTFVRSMASFGPSAHTVTNSVKPLVSRSRTLYRALWDDRSTPEA